MDLPKHPWLRAIFIVNCLVSCLAATFGASQLGHLPVRPVWGGIVVGFILLLGGMTNASWRYEKAIKDGHNDYPSGPMWLLFGVVPVVASLLFWTGIALSAMGATASPAASPSTASSVLYLIGLWITGCGVALSVGLAVSPRKRG